MKENTFLILDGTALLHKHYYATIPKALYRKEDMKMQIQHTSYGTYTNAISSVLSSICSILTACNPTYFCICFEEEKDGPTPLLEQSKLLPQILSAIGIKVFNGNMDTQIHALTSTFEKTCKIQIFTRKFSYLHFVSDYTTVYLMQTNELRLQALMGKYGMYNTFEHAYPFTPDVVKDFSGVFPHQILDLLTLSFVNSDAAKLLKQYGTIREMFSDLEKMKENHTYSEQMKIQWKDNGIRAYTFSKLMRDENIEKIQEKIKDHPYKEIFIREKIEDFIPEINEQNLKNVREILEI